MIVKFEHKKMLQIDRDNLNRLSDQELFKALKQYGLNAGPVTATTRSLYEKKLRNAMDKLGSQLDSPNTTTTTTSSSSPAASRGVALTRTPTRSSKRIETIEPSYKTNEENNIEISLDSALQEPILKVNNPNASQIIIEKTTTTITTTPKQPSNTNSTSEQQQQPRITNSSLNDINDALRYSSTRNSDSPTRYSTYVPNNEDYRSSSNINRNPQVTLVRPQPSTISAPSSAQKDKYAKRLETYGLLRNDENVATLTARQTPSTSTTNLISPTNIRSRQPLHPEKSSSYGFASYAAKTENNSVSRSSAATSSGSSNQTEIKPNAWVNWKKIALVVLITSICYVCLNFWSQNRLPAELN